MLAPNRAVLERVFPDLYQRLLEESETEAREASEIKLVDTPSGDPSLMYRGIWLHSSRNPREESRRFVQATVQIPPNRKGVDHQYEKQPIILLGFGLGYIAEYIREICPEDPLIIIEPNRSILLKAFETRDLSRLLGSPGIIFILDRTLTALHDVLSLFTGKPLLIIPRPYREVDPDLSNHLVETVALLETKNRVNTATLQKFGKRWVKNIVANRACIVDIPGIQGLAGVFPSVPALVLAAGPSLDEVLPFLSLIYDRCLVIAVDTALRAALRSGIEPDFVVVVDPQYWNARHLDFCHAPNTCLVTEAAAYPSVFRHTFEHRLLCSSQYPLGRFLEKSVDPKGRLGAGGSVATTALDFALYLGAGPIWIAGLDLAYPGLKTHFSGAYFEERAFTRSNRFSPAETQSFQSLMGAQLFSAPSASGGTVLTDRRLSLYTAWFEARLRQLPPGSCKSLSPGGIKIAALEQGTVDQLLNLPVMRSELRKKLAGKLEVIEKRFFSPGERQKRQAAWERDYRVLLEGFSDLLAITKQGKQLVETLLEEKQRGLINTLEQDLAKIDEINDHISRSPIKDIAGFLFTDKTGPEEAINNGEGTDTLEQYLEYLHSFYTGMMESLNYQISLFAK